MTVNESEIGLPQLMTELKRHHALLEKHCEWAERPVLEGKLQEDIETLNETYELLKWLRELRKPLELLRGHFSSCSAEAARVRGTTEHKLDPTGRRTIEDALKQCQQPLNDLMSHIQDSTEYAKRSDDRRGGEDLNQLVSDIKALQKYHKSIKKNLKADNFGILDDAIGEFETRLTSSFSIVDRRIEKLVKRIVEIAGGLEGGSS